MKRENQTIIYFVTSNIHKFTEAREMFELYLPNYELKMKNIEPIEIQAKTLEDVALYKLKSVRNSIKNSYFIEDAGLFIDIPLKGFPGVYSSYVFNTIGNEGILKLISDYNSSKAHFEAVIGLYFKSINRTILFKGITKGSISNKIRGTKGFGFDPIFIPEEKPEFTFGEIIQKEKNKLSHRGKALGQLVNFLKEN